MIGFDLADSRHGGIPHDHYLLEHVCKMHTLEHR